MNISRLTQITNADQNRNPLFRRGAQSSRLPSFRPNHRDEILDHVVMHNLAKFPKIRQRPMHNVNVCSDFPSQN